MGICTKKPDASLDIVGIEAVGGQPRYPLLPRGSGRHRTKPQPTFLQATKSGFQVDTPGGSAAVSFPSPNKGRVTVARPSTSYTTIGTGGKRTRSKRGKQRIERDVRALLNKLTMAKFDTISDRIIKWANKSEAQKDGRALIHVIRLVFESATRTTWSEMHALLCRKIMENISPNVRDDDIRDAGGKLITGGQLFRKFLLNHCKQAFERSWPAMESEGTPIKKVSERSGEVELYSGEYDAAKPTRGQALSLIQFIGELYKLQMLTERVMHECIKRLLPRADNIPEEAEIECLCRLLTTAGKLLDKPKARACMDIFFGEVEKLRKNSNFVPRTQFMLQVSSRACARPMVTSCLFYLGPYRATWTEVDSKEKSHTGSNASQWAVRRGWVYYSPPTTQGWRSFKFRQDRQAWPRRHGTRQYFCQQGGWCETW